MTVLLKVCLLSRYTQEVLPIVDDTGHVYQFKNFDKFKCFAEVCDVVNGNAAGREKDNEKILSYNIGLAIHDINYATHIYQTIQDKEGLLDIDMYDPVDKFWI